MKLNWTLTFFIIAIVVFFLQLTDVFDWRLFAFTPEFALKMPWTFVTSIFLHADLAHLIFNMFALLMFGLALENRIGPRNYLIIFFIAGIVGNIGYMLTSRNPLIPAIGMSGSIYGIMGTLGILMPGLTVYVGGFAPMPMIFAIFFWGISEFMGLFTPSSIARGAHLGGLLIGVLYGIYMRSRETKKRTRKVHITGYADWERGSISLFE
ncbi:MAG: rhomboid family intramembrane serine protease [Candidatus Aenigmatarchaeota archaeon]|nr:rhomboid family intramembrane serine protease [Candidatus Aenigmarchaeota archaeon]